MLYGWDNGKFEEVGKELEKMENSFSRGETLKGGNVKITENRLHFYFSSFLFFSFPFLFLEQLGLGLIGYVITSVT